MKLFTDSPFNSFTQTTMAVADLTKIKVEVVFVSQEEMNSKDFKEQKLVSFPYLQTDDGQLVFEGSAVATYFAHCSPASGIYGQNAFEQAKVDEWIAWNQMMQSQALPAFSGVFGKKEMQKEQFNDLVKQLKSQMMVLNKYLEDKFYLVGNNVTIADIMIANYLVTPFQTVFDGGYRKAIANVADWFERVMSLPAVVRSHGYIRMAQKPFSAFDKDAKVEPIKQEAPADAKGGKGGKGDKGGKGGKKAAEKPKETPKEKEDEIDMDDLFGDDDDDAEAAKEAAKKAKEAAGKKKKKVVIAMSLVMLEVKPLDDKVDLDKLAKELFSKITQDGLFWKTEYKKVPVAFGIFKLIVGFSLEDEKVSVDDVVERIEAMDKQVQSVDIQAFNKI